MLSILFNFLVEPIPQQVGSVHKQQIKMVDVVGHGTSAQEPIQETG